MCVCGGGGGGGGDTQIGIGDTRAKMNGIGEMRAKNIGIGDIGQNSGMWDMGLYIKKKL